MLNKPICLKASVHIHTALITALWRKDAEASAQKLLPQARKRSYTFPRISENIEFTPNISQRGRSDAYHSQIRETRLKKRMDPPHHLLDITHCCNNQQPVFDYYQICHEDSKNKCWSQTESITVHWEPIPILLAKAAVHNIFVLKGMMINART